MNTYKPGDRIELHPACDLWMMGARYGNVVKVTDNYVSVKLDKYKKMVRVNVTNLTPIGVHK